ncbi:hypothetical protein PAXRUDRAFT_799248 [Paxillus rubicundulus Ve08.2h10]|uniref:Uncharacterized protein n=1 Tax=Paxillus rubicundulus Ve08.2h10 TaxID=930991 RepID=A0A0D0D655_9AGAM|nr:hypothetical protein PAXRUDRAFT_799248 [Paxillus rubicundulus Ve08.2h10]
MTGCPKPETRKRQIHLEQQEEALADVVKTHQEEQQKPEKERRSLHTICHEVKEKWRKNKGYCGVIVSRDTVCQRLEGGRSCHQFNMETNAWLTKEEEEQTVTFCLDLAA